MRLLTFGWLLILISLVILSYTQIDLNLTISNWIPFYNFQQQMIYLGYFNRPLNTLFFTALFILLNIFYILILILVSRKIISLDQIWRLIILTGCLSWLSYNAFSHDFFNYMFTGKMITVYHANPYQYRALDFPQDDWLRFMQWTHNTLVYGPFWVVIVTIVSFLSFSKFILHFYLFKIVFALAYIFSGWVIIKIMEIKKELSVNSSAKDTALAVSLFAFHPLIIIDGLISPHIDLIMYLFVLLSILFFFKSLVQKSSSIISKNLFSSYLFLILATATKYVPVIMFPLLIKRIFKRFSLGWWSIAIFISGIIQAYLQQYGRGLQAWYLIGPVTLLFMLYPTLKLRWIILIGLVLELQMTSYLFFVFNGHW